MITTSERIHRARARYDEAVSDVAPGIPRAMAEALSNVVQDILKFEDEGWTLINKLDYESNKGLSLKDAKDVTKYLEHQTKVMGGLLGRGLRLKNNHVFGRGYEFNTFDGEAIKPRHKDIIEDHNNWSVLFSPTALKELNRILYTSGNLFIMYDETSKEFTRLAVDVGIENAMSYPEDASRIRYVLRTFTKVDDMSGRSEEVREWVPTMAYREYLKKRRKKNGPLMPSRLPIGNGSAEDTAPVRHDAIIIEKRINKDNGDVWGVPDAFSAAPWAVVYSTYLKDGARLQNALAAISFLVKVKTEAAAKAAGAKLSNGRIGQAAITGPDTDLQQVPRAGAIDLYEGRPLQAQVAANLDVSTTGIASDPGLGGSYASESALSQPETLAALSRQEDFVDLFRQIFHAIGAPGMAINFKRLDADPVHRLIQSLSMVRELGGIHQSEYRDASVELLDIEVENDSMPKPDAWTGSKASTLEKYVADPNAPQQQATGTDGNGTTPGQGKSGAVGSLDDAGNDARNSDRDSGDA